MKINEIINRLKGKTIKDIFYTKENNRYVIEVIKFTDNTEVGLAGYNDCVLIEYMKDANGLNIPLEIND